MKADPDADLLPGEWAVLGVLAGEPTHGFAVARELTPAGTIGRVWAMSRPRVYRAIDDLATRDLIESVGSAPSERGPTRELYVASAQGRRRLEEWLARPVAHVREMRSVLLLKLAFIYGRDGSPDALLDTQRSTLLPVLASLERTAATTTGFDRVLVRYRLEATRSAIRFIDEIRMGDHLGRA